MELESILSEIWKIEDPDGLLNRSDDEISSMEFNSFICNEIIPREDVFQAKNLSTGIVIDLGFYERAPNANEMWVLYIVGEGHDWEHPIDKLAYSSLSEAVTSLRAKLVEYATPDFNPEVQRC